MRFLSFEAKLADQVLSSLVRDWSVIDIPSLALPPSLMTSAAGYDGGFVRGRRVELSTASDTGDDAAAYWGGGWFSRGGGLRFSLG